MSENQGGMIAVETYVGKLGRKTITNSREQQIQENSNTLSQKKNKIKK